MTYLPQQTEMIETGAGNLHDVLPQDQFWIQPYSKVSHRSCWLNSIRANRQCLILARNVLEAGASAKPDSFGFVTTKLHPMRGTPGRNILRAAAQSTTQVERCIWFAASVQLHVVGKRMMTKSMVADYTAYLLSVDNKFQ
jgi:hypothetical protein